MTRPKHPDAMGEARQGHLGTNPHALLPLWLPFHGPGLTRPKHPDATKEARQGHQGTSPVRGSHYSGRTHRANQVTSSGKQANDGRAVTGRLPPFLPLTRGLIGVPAVTGGMGWRGTYLDPRFQCILSSRASSCKRSKTLSNGPASFSSSQWGPQWRVLWLLQNARTLRSDLNRQDQKCHLVQSGWSRFFPTERAVDLSRIFMGVRPEFRPGDCVGDLLPS